MMLNIHQISLALIFEFIVRLNNSDDLHIILYSIQMDEGQQPFGSIKNSNKQIRTCVNLQLASIDKQQKPTSYRQSFRSSNNLHSKDIYRSQNFQEPRYSVLQNKPQRSHLQSKSISVSKMRNKIKNKMHLDEDQGDEDDYTRGDKERYWEKQKRNNENEADSQKETIKVSNDRLSRYENIMSITERQNKNLKEHNKYLLEKLRKMQQRQEKIKKLYEKTKNYKLKWLELKSQIEILKQESHIYRTLLHDFKEITMIDIPVLKQKVNETEESVEEEGIQIHHAHMSKNKHHRAERTHKRGKDKKDSTDWNNGKDWIRIEEIAEQAEQKTFRDDSSPISKLNSTNDKFGIEDKNIGNLLKGKNAEKYTNNIM